MITLTLTDEQERAVRDIIENYLYTEHTQIAAAVADGYENEVRERCERWNQIITVDIWNRMQAAYSDAEINELVNKANRG